MPPWMPTTYACIVASAALLVGGAHNASVPEVRRLDIGGGTVLPYVEQGKGSTIVVVHGAGGDWRSPEPMRPLVAAQHRYVAYSRRYHWPQADGGTAVYTPAQHAEDLIAFVRALNVGPVHVVGQSAAARMVAEAALKSPQSFRSIVLAEPQLARPVDAAGVAAVEALMRDLGQINAAVRAGDTRLAAVALVNVVYGDAQAWDRLTPAQQQVFLDNQHTLPLLFSQPPVPPPSCDQLRQLAVPVLVVQGERTVAGFRAFGDRLLECLPAGSTRAIVPGARHIWISDNPQFGARAILEFVARHDGKEHP